MKYSLSLKAVCLFLLFSCALSGIAQVKPKKDRTQTKKAPNKTKKEIDKTTEQIEAEINKELDENKPTKFLVFVGEKIEVTQFTQKLKEGELPFDLAFKAKYRVIENIYGNYEHEIIEFEAFDHYGFPPFAKYETVLLFVSEYDGKLYHEKYQYFDVNKTKDGKWASCGDPYRFDDYHRKPFRSVSLEFETPVFFETGTLKAIQVKKIYPPPFFVVEGNRARCLMGAYVKDLFFIKKNGVLKARRIFK